MKKALVTIIVLLVLIGSLGTLSTTYAQSPWRNWVDHHILKTSDDRGVTSTSSISSTNDERLKLNVLLREHATLGALTLAALYKSMDTTRLMQLMNDNQNQLADEIQRIYGNNTDGSNVRDTFVTLWSQHMMEYQNYTLARRNNDTNAMNTARQNLQTISEDFGNLLGRTGRSISASTISGLMKDHVNGTLSFVDAVSQNDTTQSVNLLKSNYDQAGRFADALAQGMIADRPELFNR